MALTFMSACAECGKRIQTRVSQQAAPVCHACRRMRSGRPRTSSKSPRACLLCLESYIPRIGARPDQRWCSKSCAQAWRNGARPPYLKLPKLQKSLAQSRARRLRRAETWDGVPDDQILERDRWRCGICGQRIGRSFRYPHPRSKSIDHIVPLSEGGDDTAANKRAAHLGCNLARGNRGGGEQLAMIG